MSFKRKVKRGAKRVPMSLLDKVAYVFWILLGFAVLIASLIWLGVYIPRGVAFAEEDVVAGENWLILYAMPFCLCLAAPMILLPAYLLSVKQPLFGNPGYRAPAFTPIVRVDPIFSRAFWKNTRSWMTRTCKIIVCVMLVTLLLSSTLLLAGLQHRQVLRADNTVTAYDGFGNVVHTACLEDADEIRIGVHGRSKRLFSYYIEIDLVFDGRIYEFSTGSFSEMNREEALRYMLYLKSFFDEEEIKIENEHLVDMLISAEHCTSTEKALVYELMEIYE